MTISINSVARKFSISFSPFKKIHCEFYVMHFCYIYLPLLSNFSPSLKTNMTNQVQFVPSIHY